MLHCQTNHVNFKTLTFLSKNIIRSLNNFIKYNNLIIKSEEYKWETNMHAFTDLAIEIERRGFYNSPEWFKNFTNIDFLKIIKYFKMFSNDIPENATYFNNITHDTLVFDFCKDAIKMFKECNEELYILCCNFMKSLAMCSNNFFDNMPAWLIAGSTTGTRFRINLEMPNINNINELDNNFFLYYFVEYS